MAGSGVRQGAEKCVFAGYLGNAAAGLYAFNGATNGFSRVLRARFHNTDAVAITVNVGIVPSGGALSDVTYREVSYSLPAGSTMEYEPDSEESQMKLRNGESFVAWAGTADKIAARLEVEDVAG